MYTRRDFSKLALAAGASLGPAARALAAINSRVAGVQLGAQSYSFRDRPLAAAIAAMREIGLGECELAMQHVEPANLHNEELRQWRLGTPLDFFTGIRKQLDEAGIRLFAYTLNFDDRFTDEELDRGFQMTKAMGVDVMTTSTTLTCARRLVPLAAKYKVRVAMHGHDNTKDPNQFAKPESFAQAMEMSPNFYVNLDIGHFFAANYDPVAYIQEHHARILSLHIKDRKRDHGENLPFGQGQTPIREVLQLLKKNRWDIPANIEYEYGKPGMDTVAEVNKCFEYCKAALA
jgi:sugar phosphate isomerase/epimerase